MYRKLPEGERKAGAAKVRGPAFSAMLSAAAFSIDHDTSPRVPMGPLKNKAVSTYF
jgi:hypothetical protein